ncbi:hypothetical protein [Novosphingobium sp. KACC 22771]|uniref:hypothetical protein n=1 Tax=Novosphingobium sp. KACC 22771 TaxID=3025670 RepID=UPI0023656A74|nr:hypothetical protein [Novosphingobium sp. KACC 22771]WDF71334.1 hypothetical protein PQ467_10945 [Novosphingobium sp. KACC 22771]
MAAATRITPAPGSNGRAQSPQLPAQIIEKLEKTSFKSACACAKELFRTWQVKPYRHGQSVFKIGRIILTDADKIAVSAHAARHLPDHFDQPFDGYECVTGFTGRSAARRSPA